MIGTDAVRACVREGKTHQLINFLQTGGKVGMQTLETHLAKLTKRGTISIVDAVSKANNPIALKGELDRCGIKVPADLGLEPTSPSAATWEVVAKA